MGELEDRISSVLNDPEQFSKIAAMAKSLMGGESEAPQQKAAPDMELMGKLGSIFKADIASGSESLKMLEAMKPCLSEKRRKKLDKALTLARLARFAGFAVNGMGDEDV